MKEIAFPQWVVKKIFFLKDISCPQWVVKGAVMEVTLGEVDEELLLTSEEAIRRHQKRRRDERRKSREIKSRYEWPFVNSGSFRSGVGFHDICFQLLPQP